MIWHYQWCLSPIFMRWSAPSGFKTDSLTVILGGCILPTFIQMQLCDNINCCLDCLWTTLPPAMIWMLVHLFILNKVFLCHYQMLNITLMDFDDSSSDSFFAPSWSEYCLFSFLGSTVLPSGGQRFKECREMLMSFLSRILQTQSMFLFENLSCSGIKSHIFKDHVYSKSSCWDEIRDVSFFEGLLKKKNNSSFFGQRPNTRYSM
jgi:hypothetical protein